MLIKFIDFFAGMGGASYGLIKSGLYCAGAVETKKKTRHSYQQNFQIVPYADVANLHPSKLSAAPVFFASFPFQHLSIVNRTVSARELVEPFNYAYFFDYVDYWHPFIIVIEMIEAVECYEAGGHLEAIRNLLSFLGYKSETYRLSNEMVGAALRRKGLYLIATAKELPNFRLRIPKIDRQSIQEAIYPKQLDWQRIVPPDQYVLYPPPENPIDIPVNFRGYIKQDGQDEGYLPTNKIPYYCRIYEFQGLFPGFMGAESSYRYYIYDSLRNFVYQLDAQACYQLMGFGDDFILPLIESNSCSLLGHCSPPLIAYYIGMHIQKYIKQYYVPTSY